MNIEDLNEDCLEYIFSYCYGSDFSALSKASPCFERVIENIFYRRTLDSLICGHRGNPAAVKRTLDELSYADRDRLAHNWVIGRYTQAFFPGERNFSKICLERDRIYLAHDKFIRIYRRDVDQVILKDGEEKIRSSSGHKIVSFVKKGDTIFAGHEYKTCFIREANIFSQMSVDENNSKLLAVEFDKDVYITATKNRTRVWRQTNSESKKAFELINEYDKGCKSLGFSSSGDRLFLGPYKGRGLGEIDLTTGVEQQLNSLSHIILSIKVKDENVLMTANSDGTFRVYDRRVDRDVSSCSDQDGLPLVCLEYDGLHGVLCGYQCEPWVALHDIRVANRRRRLYFLFPQTTGLKKSITDMACDSRYLYITTSQHMRVLDFKASIDEEIPTWSGLVNENWCQNVCMTWYLSALFEDQPVVDYSD